MTIDPKDLVDLKKALIDAAQKAAVLPDGQMMTLNFQGHTVTFKSTDSRCLMEVVTMLTAVGVPDNMSGPTS